MWDQRQKPPKVKGRQWKYCLHSIVFICVCWTYFKKILSFIYLSLEVNFEKKGKKIMNYCVKTYKLSHCTDVLYSIIDIFLCVIESAAWLNFVFGFAVSLLFQHFLICMYLKRALSFYLAANKDQIFDQLKLALAWNRIDIAKSEIFTDDRFIQVKSWSSFYQ